MVFSMPGRGPRWPRTFAVDAVGRCRLLEIAFGVGVVNIPSLQLGLLKEALDPLPNKVFDPALVSVPYADDVGTAYIDAYEREAFNLNKTDDHGNSLLLISAQNGSDKIAKLLIQKGANPNHQNKLGQTAGHFANAYEFYDYLGWLFDPNGGGADDQLKNKEGLGVYDGITGDG